MPPVSNHGTVFSVMGRATWLSKGFVSWLSGLVSSRKVPQLPNVAETPWPADRPLVSVVVVNFNYRNFLRAAVESVLAQTFENLEIIIVEGGSTELDSRWSAAKLAASNRVKILYRLRGHLPGNNRNFGIVRARGKYICCLDADDVLHPTYIEKAVFLLETQDLDVVSSQHFGLVSSQWRVPARVTLESLLQANGISTAAVFSRALWERAGGYIDAGTGRNYIYEDRRLWVRMAGQGARFSNIAGETLLCHRIHGRNMTLDAEVPSYEKSGLAIRDLNADVINAHTIEQSRRLNAEVRRPGDGLRNVQSTVWKPRQRGTLLIAVVALVIGGSERGLTHLIPFLREQGWRVILVSTYPAPEILGDSTAWFECHLTEIYQLPRFLSQDDWPQFCEYLIQTKTVDLIWIIGSAFFYDELSRLKQKFPFLRVVDMLYNLHHYADGHRSAERLLDATLVQNDEMRRHLEASGHCPSRICLIRSGTDLDFFNPDNVPHMECPLQKSPDDFVVGFAGRWSEEKNPLGFVRVAAALRNTSRLRFIMIGMGAMKESLEQAVADAGLGKSSFRFVSAPMDIRVYLAMFDLLMLPSLLDSRPRIIMEAASMGVPAVALRVGGVPEMIIDSETGFLCEPNDDADFIKHIQWLLRNPDVHSKMRGAARRFAEDNFDMRRSHQQYDQFFVSLLKS